MWQPTDLNDMGGTIDGRSSSEQPYTCSVDDAKERQDVQHPACAALSDAYTSVLACAWAPYVICLMLSCGEQTISRAFFPVQRRVPRPCIPAAVQAPTNAACATYAVTDSRGNAALARCTQA